MLECDGQDKRCLTNLHFHQSTMISLLTLRASFLKSNMRDRSSKAKENPASPSWRVCRRLFCVTICQDGVEAGRAVRTGHSRPNYLVSLQLKTLGAVE